MANEKAITITKTYDLAKPTEVVQMATTLKNYIVKQGLFTNIKGKNYAHVDGWQFAGFLVGMTAAIEEESDLSNDKETKWKVRARLYQGDKQTPYIGVALCSNKEVSKKGFDEYAVLSMAQTRAIGKAYRNRVGWVMKLAGYESTPTEEMVKVGEVIKEEPVRATVSYSGVTGKEKQKLRCTRCADEVTEQVANYSQKAFGKILCREHQPSKRK